MSASLSPEEAIPYLHGCCGTYELDGRTGFSRFTEEELSYYGARSDTDFVRSHAPAGIRLECITDAPEISFTYRLYREKGLYVIGSGFDIWENDRFGAVFRIDPQNTDAVTVSYARRCSGPSRIRIRFTGGSTVLFDGFCLGDAAPVENRSRTVLFYGDSITQSAYIPAPSLSWTDLAAGWLDAEHLNRGIGSMIFEAPALPSAPDCSPDLLFIEYGCNDIGKTPDNEKALASAEEWLGGIRRLYPDVPKYCILPGFIPREGVSEEYRQRLAPYCTALSGLCAAAGISVLPGRSLIPDISELYYGDHVHFNEAGSALFAGNLVHALRQDGIS